MVMFGSSGIPAKTLIVQDPWNLIHNLHSAERLAEIIGISVDQLYELVEMVELTTKVLDEATQIHHATTDRWAIEERVRVLLDEHVGTWIQTNVPLAYHDLMTSLVNGHLSGYFTSLREDYPMLTDYERDPWHPESARARYYTGLQERIDAADVMVQYQFDRAPETYKVYDGLRAQLPQPHINGAVAVLTEATLQSAYANEQFYRAQAARDAAGLQDQRRLIEGRRNWANFVNVRDPATRFGFLR